MNTTPEVIVVGLGVHGAAIAHELARRGTSVLGVDMHTPPHPYGSSSGRTRITREAYFEHPLYVPLVQRAGEVWAELEELTGTVLFRRTGALMIGQPEGVLVQGALASARTHALPHELLDPDELRRRYPAVDPPAGAVALVERDAGVLLVEPCVRTLLELARGYGAAVAPGTHITSWHTAGGEVVLRGAGCELRAPRVVFAAGPWLPALLRARTDGAPLELPLEVERQTTHSFTPPPELRHHPAHPVVLLEYEPLRFLYTVPEPGHGVKAALHHGGVTVDPDTVDRTVALGEQAHVRALLDRFLPGVCAPDWSVDSAVCLYTNTPDHHFLVDPHPDAERVLLVSACSGHGFKFAPALAEVVADLVLEGECPVDVTPFRLARLLPTDTARRTGRS